MKGYADRGILIAATVRYDEQNPESFFVTLRRYDLAGDQPPDETVDVASVEEALEVLERWFRSVAV